MRQNAQGSQGAQATGRKKVQGWNIRLLVWEINMLKQLADIVAVLILADTEVSSQEIAAFVVGCEGLGFKTEVIEKTLWESLQAVEKSSNQDEFFQKACQSLPANRRDLALAIGVSVVLADEVLEQSEVDRLIALRLMLGLSEDSLIKFVAQMASVQPNLEVVV